MSMIAINKKDKELHINELELLQWSGNTSEVMIHLDNIKKVL